MSHIQIVDIFCFTEPKYIFFGGYLTKKFSNPIYWGYHFQFLPKVTFLSHLRAYSVTYTGHNQKLLMDPDQDYPLVFSFNILCGNVLWGFGKSKKLKNYPSVTPI